MSNTAEQTHTDGTTWKDVLAGEKEKSYFSELTDFVTKERESKTVYPPAHDVYNALKFTPFENVKVVLVGQDPYHGQGQAHGLCFSVQKPVPPPPSLVNIYKELLSDLGIPRAKHGFLESWAQQGVLMLNAVLTVRAGTPGSHANKGWEQFTDRIISEVATRKQDVVFLLWGAYAQKKGANIDRKRHTVLTSPHPSPFSANNGFFGCKHFSKTNEALALAGLSPIDWQLPE